MKTLMENETAARFTRCAIIVIVLFASTGSTPYATHGFDVTNIGQHAIREIHISPVTMNNWGPDLLHGVPMNPGEHKRFDIVEGCNEDIRLVYSDVEKISRGLDTCQYDLKASY